MPAIIHQPDGSTTFEPFPNEEEDGRAHRLELHGRFGLELTTDEYVALARCRLAQSPAVAGVPGAGAVLDAATEAKIGTMLGPDLTAAVRRLYPNGTLSTWVSKNFGSIAKLGQALAKHKAAGSPVALSARATDSAAATAMIIRLEMNRG